MKKGLLYLGMMAVAMGFATSNVNAQITAGEAVNYTLPAMALINVVNGATSLSFVTPAPGAPVAPAIKSDSWINYTSIVDATANTKITVALSAAVPAGTTLKIEAAAVTGGSDGAVGTVVPGGTSFTAAVIASADLINTIGSCYTGVGATLGNKITYTWTVNAGYTAVKALAVPITATYTIVAAV